MGPNQFDLPDQSSEDAARQEASRAIDTALVRMARAAGVEITNRPAWPGAQSNVVPVVDPAAGIRFALMLQDTARQSAREQIKRARENGLTWAQVGEALRLGPVAEERGVWIADLAFDFAADVEHSRPWERLTVTWTCQACGEYIHDRGPSGGHPEDDEPGHAVACERLARLWAEHDTRNQED